MHIILERMRNGSKLQREYEDAPWIWILPTFRITTTAQRERVIRHGPRLHADIHEVMSCGSSNNKQGH